MGKSFYIFIVSLVLFAVGFIYLNETMPRESYEGVVIDIDIDVQVFGKVNKILYFDDGKVFVLNKEYSNIRIGDTVVMESDILGDNWKPRFIKRLGD